MTKLIQINTVCNGSTGRIMGDIQRTANENGFETISFYGRRKGFKDIKCEKIGNPISFWIHVIINTIFDKQGHGSYFYTKKLVKRLREEKPDIIHLHNIHGYYLNHKVLFDYIKKEYSGKLFWTFHDCWPFTGHCAYFTAANCNKWETKCYNCPNKKVYPISLFKDNSKKNYFNKKELFNGIKNLTIITPSDWLRDLTNKSFLKNYEVVTINNGIDINIYKTNKDSNIYEKYGIPNKKILLGVASIWEERKGLDDFIELSKKIDDNYIIVLVGLNKKQIAKMPNNIIGIERTENVNELVKLYSNAYVFLNLTHEDNYPTVNLESIACGTPVITYNTGGCKEQVNDITGIVIDSYNINDVITEIEKVKDINFDNDLFKNEYNKNKKYNEIIELYRK